MRKGKAEAEFFRNLPDRAQEVWFSFCNKLHKDRDDFCIGIATRKFNSWNYSKCQSPIEVILAFAYDLLTLWIEEVRVENETSYSGLLIPQYEVVANNGKKYIPDFVFMDDESPLKVAIECDGHEFHERTKEQVIKDNEREYELKLMGFEVLRFSGSQIYNDPFVCAVQILRFIDEKRKKVIVQNGYI